MADPTLAEMVTELDKFAWNLRSGPDVAKALVPMLREIDRRLTALEGRGLDPELQRDAAKICAFLDGCTAQITVDELARWVGLPAARVIEVVGRTGLRHRWLV